MGCLQRPARARVEAAHLTCTRPRDRRLGNAAGAERERSLRTNCDALEGRLERLRRLQPLSGFCRSGPFGCGVHSSRSSRQKRRKPASPGQLSVHKSHAFCLTAARRMPSSTRTQATASADRTARVWDAVRGYCTHAFKGHEAPVQTVIFHPDAAKLLLFTGSDDTQVGSLLQFSIHESQVLSLQRKGGSNSRPHLTTRLRSRTAGPHLEPHHEGVRRGAQVALLRRHVPVGGPEREVRHPSTSTPPSLACGSIRGPSTDCSLVVSRAAGSSLLGGTKS